MHIYVYIVYNSQFHGNGYNLPQNKSVNTLLVVYLWFSHIFADTSILKENHSIFTWRNAQFIKRRWFWIREEKLQCVFLPKVI